MVKTTNILARVEPDVKAKAESIMAQLGVPASVVINMLYKQIIITKSIPFPLTVSKTLQTDDEMDAGSYSRMMQKGLSDAKTNNSRLSKDVFYDLRKETNDK